MKFFLKLLDVTVYPNITPGESGDDYLETVFNLSEDSNTLFFVLIISTVILLLLLAIALVRRVNKKVNFDANT